MTGPKVAPPELGQNRSSVEVDRILVKIAHADAGIRRSTSRRSSAAPEEGPVRERRSVRHRMGRREGHQSPPVTSPPEDPHPNKKMAPTSMLDEVTCGQGACSRVLNESPRHEALHYLRASPWEAPRPPMRQRNSRPMSPFAIVWDPVLTLHVPTPRFTRSRAGPQSPQDSAWSPPLGIRGHTSAGGAAFDAMRRCCQRFGLERSAGDSTASEKAPGPATRMHRGKRRVGQISASPWAKAPDVL